MIFWDSDSDKINLGELETKYCEVCEKRRTFHLILEYRYRGLYWVFNFITKKQYMVLCPICEYGGEIDKWEVEPDLGKVPIPFMRRYGMVTLILIGMIGKAVSSYMENQNYLP